MEKLYQEFLNSSGICTDTRRVMKNALFFALKGESFDGNRFVETALEKGCRLAVCERADLGRREDVIYVPSVLETLQGLARHHRMQLAIPLLAITGSNGKTTTKELCATVLSEKHQVAATRGNLNNHIGVPLTLLALKDEELAVVEMGANHPGEIAALSRIAGPGTGLITNVGRAHLEGFGSLEGVLDAKAELYAYLASTEGTALVDGSDRVLLERAGRCGVRIRDIGARGELEVEVRLLAQNPYLEVDLVLEGQLHRIRTRLVGAYNLQNIKLAAGCGLHFGIPGEQIARALASYVPSNQRSQLVEGGRNKVVLDSYNANPSSMRQAVEAFLDYAPEPRMLILGDMAELGSVSAQEHRELADWLAGIKDLRVVLVGERFSGSCSPSSGLSVFSDRAALEDWLKKEQPEGLHILVKGSRVMEMEQLKPLLV